MNADPLPRLLAAHARRTALAVRGFRLCGWRWLAPWVAYALSPALTRLLPRRELRFGTFHVRLGACDLYTFANLFEDYHLPSLRRALGEVEQVVDAGANVGAFCWLARTTATGLGRPAPRVVALEPDAANAQFLASQPFAAGIELRRAALGAREGRGRLRGGINSVTHTVECLSELTSEPVADGDDTLPVHDLETLCAGRPTLLKMDIEGGERSVLEGGLPEVVRFMFLEWHPGPGWPAEPATVLPRGRWHFLSRDLWGSSCWFWEASPRPSSGAQTPGA